MLDLQIGELHVGVKGIHVQVLVRDRMVGLFNYLLHWRTGFYPGNDYNQDDYDHQHTNQHCDKSDKHVEI